ncbi:MAG: NAD-dependent epimerase/dehydratase family protein [Deltaproteobacteria bacterium]|nr:NAD-dependent epimerase/dehydratase family protein [Deltaproteobacteria bacterium]
MKALVAGASGFVGSTLIECLQKEDLEVHAMLRATSSDENLKNLKYKRVDASFADLASLKQAVQGMDYIFHLAGTIFASSREDYFRINTEGTRKLAQAIGEVGYPVKNFIFVSSLAAGGPSHSLTPRSELDTDAPVSAYGESKLQAEKELSKYNSKIPIIILRPPMVYGPKDKATLLFFKTVSRHIVPMFNGQKYYTAIHVRDLCHGIIKAAFSNIRGEIFYLTNDNIFTYEELMTTIAKHLNKKIFKFRIPDVALIIGAHGLSWYSKLSGRTYPLNNDKLHELRPDYWICSGEKARKGFGFSAETNLSDGLLDTIKWYKKYSWL